MKDCRWFLLSTLIVLSPFACESALYPASVSSALTKRESSISEIKKRQIICALAAFDTIQSPEVIYVSCPITSGNRLYAYMDAQGFSSYEEAKRDGEAFFQHVILPNIQESERASLLLAHQSSGVVISPTAFEKRFQGKEDRWEQDEFMSMWISMIHAKVTQIVLLNGWEYSSGASEEYLTAVLMQMGFTERSNIAILDAQGQSISLDQGIELLYRALVDLEERKLASKKLAELLASLFEAEEIYVQQGLTTIEYDYNLLQKLKSSTQELFQKSYPDLLPLLERI